MCAFVSTCSGGCQEASACTVRACAGVRLWPNHGRLSWKAMNCAAAPKCRQLAGCKCVACACANDNCPTHACEAACMSVPEDHLIVPPWSQVHAHPADGACERRGGHRHRLVYQHPKLQPPRHCQQHQAPHERRGTGARAPCCAIPDTDMPSSGQATP